MWVLFIVVLLQGQQITKYQVYSNQVQCNQGKAELSEMLAGSFPSADVSLTCVKINKLGKLT